MKTKHILTIVLILTISSVVRAQFLDDIYVGVGWQQGTYNGLSWDLNYIHLDKYSLQLRASGGSRKATNAPQDSKKIFRENYNAFELQIGRVYRLNNSGSITSNLKTGLAYNFFKHPIRYERNYGGISFFGETSSRYKAEFNMEKNLGLVINPSIKIHLFKRFYFAIAPYINVNSYRMAYEGQVRLIYRN